MWAVHGLFWWLLVILGVVVLVRVLAVGSRGATSVPPPAETALDILKKRYARGEIGKEEFEAKKRDIAV
jgi:putative membrane protein